MQTVSENWKDAHKRTILSESFVEVSLDIADPDALADASSEDNGAIYISDSTQLVRGLDRNFPSYCTLEQNLWCLDGSRKAIPEREVEDTSYVSDVMSDETCIFSTKIPTITIRFSKVFEALIPGLTITWSSAYGEFADTFTAIAYNGDEVVATKEVTGNRSVESIVFSDIKGYDRIVISITKWCLPNHRARVETIFIGLNKIYGKGNLFDYSHKQSVDPLSISLPKFEIQFSIDNVNGEYNPYNKEGLAKYLMERQEVKARYGLKKDDGSIEWIPGGTFYLSEWYAKQNGLTADFTARDLLEFMSAIYYDNVTSISERSLYDLAQAVLQQADLPLNSDGTVKWVIDDSLKTIYTSAPLPEDSLANCLQLIANAGECVLYQDRSGTLHIEPIRVEETDYSIDAFNSYSKSEITLAKPIKRVDVKVYEYTIGDRGIESKTIDVSVTVGNAGEIVTIDNPLITDTERAFSFGTWLATELGHRMTLDSTWRADVRLDALDIVTNANEYQNNRVRMTDVEFRYSGAFHGNGKGKVI